jgi:hypothetical protein
MLDRLGGVIHHFGVSYLGVDPDVDPNLFRFNKQELDDLADSGLALAKRSRLFMAILKRFYVLMFGLTVAEWAARARAESMLAVKTTLRRYPQEEIDDDGDPTGTGTPQVVAKARDIPVVGRGRQPVPSDVGGGPGADSDRLEHDAELRQET